MVAPFPVHDPTITIEELQRQNAFEQSADTQGLVLEMFKEGNLVLWKTLPDLYNKILAKRRRRQLACLAHFDLYFGQRQVALLLPRVSFSVLLPSLNGFSLLAPWARVQADDQCHRTGYTSYWYVHWSAALRLTNVQSLFEFLSSNHLAKQT